MIALRALCVIAAVCAAACIVDAQPDPMVISYWSSAVPATTYPARTLTTAAIDPLNNIYVVGGSFAANVSANDAWMSSDLGNTWVCQSCINPDPTTKFSPRDTAGLGVDQAGTLYLIGGIEDTAGDEQHSPQMWNSTDKGVTWNLMTEAGPWSLQVQDGAPFILFDSSDNMWVLGGGHMWFAENDGLYNDFMDKGAISLGDQARFAYGALMTQDDKIYIAGGQLVQGGAINDVWAADITKTPVTFEIVTANAPWSARVAPSLVEDAFGNLYIYGQYATPEGSAPADLMWVSPNPQDDTTVLGAEWVRLDGRDCASRYPFPVATVPGYFSIVTDGWQRMFFIGGGVANGGNPTGADSTAMVQLLSDPEDEEKNRAAGLTQWDACTPPGPGPHPDPHPPKPGGGGGMSGGATAAVVILVLLLVGGGIAAFVYRHALMAWVDKMRNRNAGLNTYSTRAAAHGEFQSYQTM